ncbi:unnamed protein product [Oikopleura dioica]|uniref:Major facilitator superfamily (MFS) profile domain-containing protein n=1 Tax=Oikopleura dioica TaxID=34765 RepID=E4YCR3_OIKDI|nr:unnamed protein product [Oikopleura dioica]
MVNRTHQEQGFSQNSSSEVVCGEQHVGSDVGTDGPFMYSNTQQSLLLSSYYYGYCFFSIAGGYIVHKCGIRKTVTFALLTGGLLSLFIPELLKTDEGINVIGPAGAGCWTNWGPESELSFLTSLNFCTNVLGTSILNTLGGWMGAFFGWESIFYASAVSNLLVGLLWYFLVAESPEKHATISEEERCFIIETRRSKKIDNDQEIPLLSIFTSPVVLAMIVGNLTSNWGTLTLSILFPKYLADVQGYDIASVGWMVGMTTGLNLVACLFTGKICDFIHQKWNFSRLFLIRACVFIAGVPSALFAFGMSVVGCNISLILSLVCLQNFFMGFDSAGSKPNAAFIAPAFAGFIMSIQNCLACTPGFLSPIIAGGILDGDGNLQSKWRTVFQLEAAVLFTGALFFCVLGSASVQPWAEKTNSKKLLAASK